MVENHTQELLGALRRHENGSVIMTELPSDTYMMVASSSLRALLEDGFEGVYISFQRPFSNLVSVLKDHDVNVEKLIVVDVASAIAQEERAVHDRCVHISEQIDINELVRAIYTSLPRLSRGKRFVFIDSISTISLHKPLSETLRFSEFLMRTVKKASSSDVTHLIFNVAQGLSQKKFIKDIALKVHETIRV
jgi:KaiC/GvpD/RAD55 family RecA-like ATPase